MKKIIDGKLYETDKAEMIFSYYTAGSSVVYDPMRPPGKYEIFITQKGNYFVYVEKEQILFKTDEIEVKKIIAKCDVEKYIELFGDSLEEA
jgi:hypothetical protein